MGDDIAPGLSDLSHSLLFSDLVMLQTTDAIMTMMS